MYNNAIGSSYIKITFIATSMAWISLASSRIREKNLETDCSNWVLFEMHREPVFVYDSSP